MAKHKHIPAPSPARIRLATATAAAAALTGGLFTVSASTASAAEVSTATAHDDADFNGDGFGDTVASASNAYVNGRAGAGQVAVIYGQALSPGTTGGYKTAAISQDTPGVPGTAESGDYFGADSAYGDFNGDGYDDLLVGAPGEDVGSDTDGGTAAILWGSPQGLTSGTTVADPRPSSHDGFGAPVEAADFNGDGKDDLAIAAGRAATVDVFSGGFTRTNTTGRHYTIKTAVPSGGDLGGVWNLHSGDANGDGMEDLIVNGVPADGYDANYWLPGSASGVTTTGAQRLTAGIITDLGDIDEDGYDDIVIGNSWDSGIAGATKGGSVYVIHGTASGPSSGETEKFTQDTAGIPGASESGDEFGGDLDLGDVNGDGHLDLVVGAPGEDLTGGGNTGAATVLYGAADGSGITGTGALFLHQNNAANFNESGDEFGYDVHLDDLNGDGRDSVVIGAPGENGGNGAVYPIPVKTDGTIGASAGIYTSTLGISATGEPNLGANFTD